MSRNLRRRGGVYWFRRRVPDCLRDRFPSGEISHSLQTSCSREAASRARSTWLETEQFFNAMKLNAALTAAQARVILERLATEPLLNSQTSDELVASAAGDDWTALRSLFDTSNHAAILSLPEETKLAVGLHMTLLLERVEVLVAREAKKTAELRTGLEMLRSQRERERADEAEAALLQSERAGSVAAEVAGRLKELSVMVPPPFPMEDFSPRPATPYHTQQPAPDGLLLSTWEEAFLSAKQYGTSERPARKAISLWLELIGDRQPLAYTRKDVMEFQRHLRAMPASHGKDRKDEEASVRVKRTSGADVDRLSDKTIKKHFSFLRQLWKHIGEDDAAIRIWDGIEHKVQKNKRLNWSSNNLDLLLRARWNPTNRPGNRISEETHAWLVALAAYTGARLEDLARIRANGLVREDDGVVSFFVAPEVLILPGRKPVVPYEPKMPASVREVPVHARLLAAGLLEFAEARVAAGAKYLLDLGPTDKEENLSAEYSRNFSRHKIDLGIGPENVFHSFRHSVETILASKNVK